MGLRITTHLVVPSQEVELDTVEVRAQLRAAVACHQKKQPQPDVEGASYHHPWTVVAAYAHPTIWQQFQQLPGFR